MEFCGRDQQGSLISPSNEADSGYEPSPSSTTGPCTMFSFEGEHYSDPEDCIPSYEILSPDLSCDSDDGDDMYASVPGRPSSSPIPIPLSRQSVLLSRSSPGFGYSTNNSPLRRMSCPSQFLLQQGLVRIVRHVATQTRSPIESASQDIISVSENAAADEHRLAPMRGPLPDVVQHNGRRLGHVERARSASVSLPVGSHAAVFTEIGQTLRRLSDEFERTRRSNMVMLSRSSSRRSRSYSQSDT